MGKKILVGFLGLLAVFLGAIVSGYAYLGGFASVEVERGEFGPVEIIYTLHRGSYQGLAKSWKRFQSEWERAGIPGCDSLAVYFDPPGTPDDQLRSVLACRIDAQDEAQKQRSKASFPSFVLPRSRALTSRFPFKNMLSFMIGPTKVYPKMREAMEEGVVPAVAIETYGVTGKFQEIGFYMPIGIDRSAYQPLLDAFER
jgi:hypothetical protein